MPGYSCNLYGYPSMSMQQRQRSNNVSETNRVLGELGVDRGSDTRLGKADRDLIMDALRLYGEHLLTVASTVRTVKPSGADRKPVAAYLDTTAARANLLANAIDISESVTIGKVGEG